MKGKFAVLRQLDNQLLAIKEHGGGLVPKEGWVSAIRKSLGMTIKQLAARLCVDHPSRVVKIEVSEINGAVTLRTFSIVCFTVG